MDKMWVLYNVSKSHLRDTILCWNQEKRDWVELKHATQYTTEEKEKSKQFPQMKLTSWVELP